MANTKRSNRYNSGKGTEKSMVNALDDLAAFDDFKSSILPKIREMMKAGKGATEIYEFAQAFAAARAVTIALTSDDERNAISGIKEILDRGIGKAADKLEVTQRYSKMSDEELDALIKSQEQDVEDENLQKH